MMRKAQHRPHRKPPVTETSWAVMNQVYNHARHLQEMLAMLPDKDLAAAKREMCNLEDLLWQAVDDRRR